jgi:hypothetical protein
MDMVRREERTMTQVILPAAQAGDVAHVQINVFVQAEVIAAEAAHRRANVWLLEHAGNLLRAESPELVLGEPLTWRVDVMLTSPRRGTVDWVG